MLMGLQAQLFDAIFNHLFQITNGVLQSTIKEEKFSRLRVRNIVAEKNKVKYSFTSCPKISWFLN